MLAAKQPPQCNTSADFFRGKGTLADQFSEDEQKMLDVACKAQGFTPNRNSVYMPGLARCAFDRQAFIDPSDHVGHVEHVCAKNDWDCNGAVKVRRPRKEPATKKKSLSNDLIAKNMDTVLQNDPSLRKKDIREIKEAVIEKHGYE